MKAHNRDVDAIVNNSDEPTFANTIVALEKSGALLDRVTTVFGNLLSAETSDELEALAERMMPRLSEHSNNISLNEKLFARIKQVYDHTDLEALNQEERMLLQNTYQSFIRNGANLAPEQKERFRQRFMHKLVYFPANNDGMYSCVGCGRCVDKCPSHLNIVKVIKAFGKEGQ